MRVEFHPEADAELSENAAFYEQRVPGLGYRFLEEIERGLDLLAVQPQIGTPLTEVFRTLVLTEFPFSLIYSVEPEKIRVVAVAHQRRRPRYWSDRT